MTSERVEGNSEGSRDENRAAPSKRRRRAVLTWAVCLLILASLALLADIQWGNWPGPVSDVLPSHADAIVVLGGGGEDRVQTAAQLFTRGIAPVLIVSGDEGKIVSGLRQRGIADTYMIHEPNAQSTLENALLVYPILQQLHAKNVVLVTSWFHTRRAKAVFTAKCPDIRFYIHSATPPETLSEFDRNHQRRERYAIAYYALRYGIW
jgi:uncharacterized SAM-binding protein YcdF (DUF218 family)